MLENGIMKKKEDCGLSLGRSLRHAGLICLSSINIHRQESGGKLIFSIFT